MNKNQLLAVAARCGWFASGIFLGAIVGPNITMFVGFPVLIIGLIFFALHVRAVFQEDVKVSDRV